MELNVAAQEARRAAVSRRLVEKEGRIEQLRAEKAALLATLGTLRRDIAYQERSLREAFQQAKVFFFSLCLFQGVGGRALLRGDMYAPCIHPLQNPPRNGSLT
jgi:hypothetical protein